MENSTGGFPEILRALRGDKTQKEVAKELHITHQTLSFYEAGKRKPDIEVLTQIAKYYRVSTDYLLGLTKVKNPDIETRAIAEKTGLSQAAVDTIRKYKEESSDLIAALNFLLVNEDFRVALENMSKYEFRYMEIQYYFREYEAVKSSDKNIPNDLAENIFRSDDAESATEFRINKYFQDAVDTWIIEKRKQVNRIPPEELKTAFASLIESML